MIKRSSMPRCPCHSTVDYLKKTYEELKPSTTIRMRGTELCATIVKTVWQGKSDGVDVVGEEMWETDPVSKKRLPAYLLQYESGNELDENDLVLCCDVHDEWEVLTTPAPVPAAALVGPDTRGQQWVPLRFIKPSNQQAPVLPPPAMIFLPHSAIPPSAPSALQSLPLPLPPASAPAPVPAPAPAPERRPPEPASTRHRNDVHQTPASNRKCVCCHRSDEALLVCALCRLLNPTHYCSKECQVDHWPEHRAQCKLHRGSGSGGHSGSS